MEEIKELQTYLVYYRELDLNPAREHARPVEARNERNAVTEFRKKYGFDYKRITKVERY